MRQKIFEQQCIKYEKTLEAQKKKMERGVKRNCTEGVSADYVPYLNAKKQKPAPGRFRRERVMPLFNLIRKRKRAKKCGQISD